MREIDLHRLSDEARFSGFHRRVLFLCALIIIFDGYDLAVVGVEGLALPRHRPRHERLVRVVVLIFRTPLQRRRHGISSCVARAFEPARRRREDR